MASQVLIIDDDANFRRLLELRLRGILHEMDLMEFESVVGARQFLLQNRDAGEQSRSFDLAILDQHLKDGRGTDLIAEGWFEGIAVLSVSSDSDPQIPGATMQAGAAYFLNKLDVSAPLFAPLVLGLIDRNRLQAALTKARLDQAVLETIKTLVSTLRHEINNPLGAVLGAAYLLRKEDHATQDQREAAELVESSGKRIKHVLDQLCSAVLIESVTKAHHKVFHIPGDKPWENKE